MRIAATDPGAADVHVTLDGKPLRLCVEACEGEGWADVIATDAQGHFIFNRRDGGFEIKRLHGPVVIHPGPVA